MQDMARIEEAPMTMRKRWPSAAIAILWFGFAQAAPPSTPEQQRSFQSAEDAVDAFVASLRNHQEADLLAILGPEAERVVSSGDQYADQELLQLFVALYDQKHAIQTSEGHAALNIGPGDWPLPIPIVETNGSWRFDTKAGEQAIVDRRIGRNELRAIRTLLACADAQRDYFDRAQQSTGTCVYARHLLSTPGHQDGLYWPVAKGESESPLGSLVDAAQEAGYPGELVGGTQVPYEGYYFRILTAQGPHSDGGAKSYLRSGQMTGGFAVVAWPARFETSGIMTFIVGPEGDVYQKDLGPDTARIAAGMTTFDPDLTWASVTLTNE